MRTLYSTPRNSFQTARSASYNPASETRVRPKLYSKALIVLFAVFMVCAFAQAVQLNSLLAESASVRQSIAELRAEQELLSAGYSQHFS